MQTLKIDIDKIKIHPRNIDIYGDVSNDDIDDLKSSIQKTGLRYPIVVSQDNILVSGHRRFEACKQLNFDQIECDQVSYDNEFDLLEDLLVCNKYRQKTIAQKTREAELYEEIEKERAKIVQIESGSLGGRPKKEDQKEDLFEDKEQENLESNLTQGFEENKKDKKRNKQSSEKAAEKVGLKRNTYETSKKVLKAAEHLPKEHKLFYEKCLDKSVSGTESAIKDDLYTKLSEKDRDAIIEGELSITNVIKQVKQEEKKKQLEEKKQEILEKTKKGLISQPEVYNIDYNQFIDSVDDCDLLLTDPPYSTDVEDIYIFVKQWLYKCLNKVKSTGYAYIFIGAYPDEVKAYLNAEIPEHIELIQILQWCYKNTLGNNPKDRYKQNNQTILFYKGKDSTYFDCPISNEQWSIQEVNAPDGRLGDRYHTWQKPIELAERFIRHTTKEGDFVIDPFCCTGTFLISASKLDRKSKGCDISKDNLQIAIDRGCIYGR